MVIRGCAGIRSGGLRYIDLHTASTFFLYLRPRDMCNHRRFIRCTNFTHLTLRHRMLHCTICVYVCLMLYCLVYIYYHETFLLRFFDGRHTDIHMMC